MEKETGEEMMLNRKHIIAVKGALRDAENQYAQGRVFYRCRGYGSAICDFACNKCVLSRIHKDGCNILSLWGNNSFTPIEDVAGFLKSLLVSLEEIK